MIPLYNLLPNDLKNAYSNSLVLSSSLCLNNSSNKSKVSFFSIFHCMIGESLKNTLSKMEGSSIKKSIFSEKTITEIIKSNSKELLNPFDSILFDILQEYPILKEITNKYFDSVKMANLFLDSLHDELTIENDGVSIFPLRSSLIDTPQKLLSSFEFAVKKSNNLFLNNMYLNLFKIIFSENSPYSDIAMSAFKNHVVDVKSQLFKFPDNEDMEEYQLIAMLYYYIIYDFGLFNELINLERINSFMINK